VNIYIAHYHFEEISSALISNLLPTDDRETDNNCAIDGLYSIAVVHQKRTTTQYRTKLA